MSVVGRKIARLFSRSSLHTYSDEELVERYRSTVDSEIVAELMSRYHGQIAAFGFKSYRNQEEVKDFVQEVFVRLSDKLKRQEVKNFKAWLYAMMKNYTADEARRRLVRSLHAESDHAKKESLTEESYKQIEREMDGDRLRSALLSLSDIEQACLMGIFFDGKSYAELMEEYKLSFNQLRGLKDRSLKKLKAILQDKDVRHEA